MKKEKRVWYLLLMIVLILSACGASTAGDGSAPSGEPASGAAVVEDSGGGGAVDYSLEPQKTEVAGYTWEIPMFTGMEDAGKQRRLNRKIKEKVEREIEESECVNSDSVLSLVDSRVTFQGAATASFYLVIREYHSGNTNPVIPVAVNINPMTEKIIPRSRLLWSKKKLKECFQAGAGTLVSGRVPGGEKADPGEDYRLEDLTSWKNVEVVKTEKGIGVIVSRILLPEDLGSYRVYEIRDSEYRKPERNDYFPLTAGTYDEMGTGTWSGEFLLENGERAEQEVEISFESQEAGERVWYGKILITEEGLDVRNLDIGQFLLSAGCIVKTSDSGREMSQRECDELLVNYEAPAGARTVCREEDRETREDGEYQRTERQGDEIQYTFCGGDATGGRYERYVWKKDVGLIAYRMGYGDDGDCVCVWKKGILQDESVLREDIHTLSGQTTPGQERTESQVCNPWFSADTGPVEMEYGRENGMISGRIALRWDNIENGPKGSLYQMFYNSVQDLDVEESELRPETEKEWEEFRQAAGAGAVFGYFFVTDSEIYYMDLLSEAQRRKMLSLGKVPAEAQLVCREKTIKDKKKGEGWHHYLESGPEDIRMFSSWYQNANEEGRMIRKFVWKRDRGLIGYYESATSAGGRSLYFCREEEKDWFQKLGWEV